MNIPQGFTIAFPHIFATDATAYSHFLRDGLGGEILGVERFPDCGVRNADSRCGDTTTMVSEAVRGDRQGGVADPSGNIWWLSQRLVAGPY